MGRRPGTLEGHAGVVCGLAGGSCSWEGEIAGSELQALLLALLQGPLTLRAGSERWRVRGRRCRYHPAAGRLEVRLELEAAADR